MISHHSNPMRQAWMMVGLLWFAAFLNYLDRMILITMRSSIKAAIPMSDAQFGLLTTVFLISYGLLSPVGGFLADRFNRSTIITLSLFGWSAATWLTSTATTFNEMLLYRSLMGISEAAYFPAAGALLMDYHRNKTRSLANGIHLSGVMVGSGLGGLGGWIADRQDWTFVFELFGMIGILYAGVLFFLLRDRPKDPTTDLPGDIATPASAIRPREAFLAIFSRPAFIIALLFWGCLGIASWSFSGWLPAYLHEQFGLTQGAAGLTALGYTHAASLVGMVVGGFWADRWSQRHPRGRIYVGVIGVLVAAPGVLLVGNVGILPLVLLGMVIFGFTRPFPDASMVPLLCQVVQQRYLATAVGFLNMFAVFVGGITIYIGGVLRDSQVNITNVFNFGAGGLVVCAFLLWAVKPRNDANRPSAP
jgi:predicted MFS family arabinose efflux permease